MCNKDVSGIFVKQLVLSVHSVRTQLSDLSIPMRLKIVSKRRAISVTFMIQVAFVTFAMLYLLFLREHLSMGISVLVSGKIPLWGNFCETIVM